MAKGKSSSKSTDAADGLDYLITCNRSINQAMARSMQDLFEGVFINMANLTLTCRHSYMDYHKACIKQYTLTALRNSPLHMMSFLFLDHLLTKAEEELSHYEPKRSANTSQKKPAHFDPYTQSGKQAPEPDWKTSMPAWKQFKHWVHLVREVEARSPSTNSDQPRVRVHINDNYCLTQRGLMNVAGKKDCLLNVTGTRQTWDNLHVNLPVVNHVLVAGGQSQKKGISLDIGQHQAIKYVKDVSCLDHLIFVPKCQICPQVLLQNYL